MQKSKPLLDQVSIASSCFALDLSGPICLGHFLWIVGFCSVYGLIASQSWIDVG